jgi:hypothetical protein
MGRTLPSITQTFFVEEESMQRFRRALRRSDQVAMDDLLAAAASTWLPQPTPPIHRPSKPSCWPC